MYRILTILILIIESQSVFCQKYTLNSYSEDLTKAINDWDYFLPKQIMNVQVLAYYPAHIFCGREIVNAMAIVLDNQGDSIRIIERCPGPKKILLGHSYTLFPDKDIPLDKNPRVIIVDGDPNPFIFAFPSIKKTTYGLLKSD